MQERKSAQLLNRAMKAHSARKEVRGKELQLRREEVDAGLKIVMQERKSAQLLNRAMKGHNARKEAQIRREEEE